MGGRDCCAPVTGRLRALVDGELDTAEQGAVLGHLEGCPNCRRAHRRIQEVVQLTQSVRTEEPPDHFTAALQVRLGREREARRRKLAGPGGWLRLPTPGWDSRRPWAARLAAVGLVAGGLAVGLSRPLNANEIVRRAELSWRQIRNYGCVFRSEGWYLGQHRVFRQRQFFRRPGEFRLDTSQDYPLSTFVSDHQLVHYLPGGDWQGNGPLVLIRPRRPGDDGLPFPFGRNWGRSGNINLDLVVRWMYQDQEPRLVGTEKVGDLECYHLQLTPGADGSGSRDQHDVWIDRVSFLPRRVSWRRDDQNWIVTEATELQVNYQVLPQGTFDFQIPDGACVIQGDVDPHVFALPFPAPDSGAEGLDPVSRTWNEVTRRAGNLRFPVLSPEWLPEGLQLVRVRRRTGRWLDVHWLRNGGQGVRHVLKLVEQEVSADSYPGQRVRVRSGAVPVDGWLLRVGKPYPYSELTFVVGRTQCTLSGSGFTPAELRNVARSMAEVAAPRLARSPTVRREIPSLPGDGATPPLVAEPSTEPVPTEPAEPAPIESEAPPMMPEMADEEQPHPEPDGGSLGTGR